MIKHHNSIPSKPHRVVIIGGSGFVGQDLVNHLSQEDIKYITFNSAQINLSDINCIETLASTIQPDDAIVLISALTPDKGRDINTLMKNLQMVQHFCTALEQISAQQLIYISSDAVYEDEANPVRETSCCNPSSYHGLMHLAREKMLIQTVKSRFPFMILRPSAIYGINDTHNSYGPNRFRRTAQKDQKITLFGNGEEKRDHLYINDLSRLIGLSLIYRSEGVLNAVTGKAVSFYEVATHIAKLSSFPVEIECLPRANPITHRHFDNTLSYKAFPTFKYTPLEVGLELCSKVG